MARLEREIAEKGFLQAERARQELEHRLTEALGERVGQLDSDIRLESHNRHQSLQ